MTSPYLPQFKDRSLEGFQFGASLAGRFVKMECFKGHLLGNGKVLEIAGTRHIVNYGFDNLIVNNGLDHKGGWTGNGINYTCQIGTGVVPEVITDTALGNRERAHDTLQSSVQFTQGSAPWYGSDLRVFRFNPPGSNKTYSEVGISPDGETVDNLFSRALIKDSSGLPTTIDVLADEWLDVTYELRLYPDHLTVSNASVSGFSLDLLASQVTWSGPIGWGSEVSGEIKARYGSTWSGDAVLGAVTGVPTAGENASNDAGLSTGSYVPGTYSRDMTWSWGLNEGNYVTQPGIGAVEFRTSGGLYQVKFDPPIPKTVADTLNIDANLTWTRKVIP